MKLYELPRDKGIKIDVGGVVIIFGHTDGMYSYCWREDNPEHLVHLYMGSELEEREDGTYRLVGDVVLPPGNVL